MTQSSALSTLPRPVPHQWMALMTTTSTKNPQSTSFVLDVLFFVLICGLRRARTFYAVDVGESFGRQMCMASTWLQLAHGAVFACCRFTVV
jgi:hypothetical protein